MRRSRRSRRVSVRGAVCVVRSWTHGRPLAVRSLPRSARRSRRPAPGSCSCAGMIVVWMLDCAAASAVTGPIEATTVVRSRSAAGSAPSTLHEVAHRRRAGEGHHVDAPVEQHAVDVGLAFALRLGDDRAIRDDLGDLGALPAQLVGDAPRGRCRRAAAARAGRARSPSPPARATTASARYSARHQVHLQAVAAPAARPSPARRRTA